MNPKVFAKNTFDSLSLYRSMTIGGSFARVLSHLIVAAIGFFGATSFKAPFGCTENCEIFSLVQMLIFGYVMGDFMTLPIDFFNIYAMFSSEREQIAESAASQVLTFGTVLVNLAITLFFIAFYFLPNLTNIYKDTKNNGLRYGFEETAKLMFYFGLLNTPSFLLIFTEVSYGLFMYNVNEGVDLLYIFN